MITPFFIDCCMKRTKTLMGPVCADVDDCACYLWWGVAAGQERTIMLPKTYDN